MGRKAEWLCQTQIAKLKFPDFGGEILWLSAYAGSNIRTEVPIPPGLKVLCPALYSNH